MLASQSAGTFAGPHVRRRLRDEIVHHGPTPGAVRRVHVDEQPPDGRGIRHAWLRGPRDDVIGYAAFLMATDVGVGDTAMEIVSAEEGSDGALTLLVAYLDVPPGAP